MSVRLPAHVELLAHPATAAGTTTAVSVDVDQSADGGLQFTYTLQHDGRLRVPAAQPPGAADGLWAHTCCEAFLAVAGESTYREFNFSPSGQWAVYDFADYRKPGGSAPAVSPRIDCRLDHGALQLAARIPPAALPVLPRGRLLMLGLTVVSEDAAGALQYWALRHPAAQADFHDRRGFALALALPAAPTREHA